MAWVDRNRWRITDINILAIVGEKIAPMAVPLICWKVRLNNCN